MTTNLAAAAIKSTGSTQTRTLGDRFAEVHNVVDFGADPTGGSDSQPGVQAAVNWTTNPNRGTIFFPKGSYLFTQAVTYNGVSINDNLSIKFLGEGGNVSFINGNFNGFLFDRHSASPNNTTGFRIFENLGMAQGFGSATAGCIRMGSTDGGVLKFLNLGGQVCFTSEDAPGVSSTNIMFDTCAFVANNGTLGGSNVILGGTGFATACDSRQNDTAWRIYGSGFCMTGCRTERSNVGMMIGKDSAGTAQPTSGITVQGTSNEGNLTCYWFTGGPVSGFFLNIGGIGHPSSNAGFALNPVPQATQWGLRVDANAAFSGVFYGCGFSSVADVAAVQMDNASSRTDVVFQNAAPIEAGGAGVPWIPPTNAQTAQFIRCNIQPIWTFSVLPTGGNVREGDIFDVSDINSGWGTTYTGGGTTHGSVRWNGSAWKVLSQ